MLARESRDEQIVDIRMAAGFAAVIERDESSIAAA
jgi:hypothetical protein